MTAKLNEFLDRLFIHPQLKRALVGAGGVGLSLMLVSAITGVAGAVVPLLVTVGVLFCGVLYFCADLAQQDQYLR